MKTRLYVLPAAILHVAVVVNAGFCQDQPAVALPEGVKAVWDLSKAYHQTTPTRERICINGLWRWQPAESFTDKVPAGNWGYVKVPGNWRGFPNQKVYAHSSWQSKKLDGVVSSWYQREITVPKEWTGRKVSVYTEYLNSGAVVYVDGVKAGDILFPWGEVDISAACRPGEKHVLSMLVVAMPLPEVLNAQNNPKTAWAGKGLERCGFCGDVYLVGAPPAARVTDVKVDTSTRKWQIAFDTALQGLATNARYSLRARIVDSGRDVAEFTSPPFKGGDLKDGRIAFTEKWKPDKLWDTHTPQNIYQASVSLEEPGGKVLDTALPVRFGFREFWIDGRDFYLNGTRIFLISVPLDNAQAGPAWANYEGARETMSRLRTFGVNMVYTHNYGSEPGAHLSFEEIMKAADDLGMLLSLSVPSCLQYKWEKSDADASNGYARHTEFFVRMAENHASVVFYSNHDASGYPQDMNPDYMADRVDGLQVPWRSAGSVNQAKLDLRADAILQRLDPSRVIYHHAGGNLGSMHLSNFYTNFAPVQELSDWFGPWAEKGVKPVFPCEYGAPMPWDWSMYRGWYHGKREFGSAVATWEACIAEWDAQFFGDRVFRISESEKVILRFEGEHLKNGSAYNRWDYPGRAFDSQIVDEYQDQVYAAYFTDNMRAFRTWGVSATNSAWDWGVCWKLRDNVNKAPKRLKVDWENLQRPGLSPDFMERGGSWMSMAFERSDWKTTTSAEALIQNGQPLLAYIGGKPARFTSKDHNFYPGEQVEKQLIVINNSRETVSGDCQWALSLPQAVAGKRKISVKTGEQERIPLRFDLPADLAPGKYALSAVVTFGGGQTQKDSFAIHVLPKGRPPKPAAKVALFDPRGETGKVLGKLGFQCQPVEANTDLSAYGTLIIGKAALTPAGAGPDLSGVRDGLKVIVFEQTSEVLEKRLGFRVEEYGLRQVFKRTASHPIVNGIEAEHLGNWRGEATILPPRLKSETDTQQPFSAKGPPTIKWCDIAMPHPWRCGCVGNVASVLIEKPACGDFLPIIDGGFSLQYSPLLEYREGKGLVLFCQMDVTGRTESDPAAERLAGNIMDYVSAWKPGPGRKAVYAGNAAGKTHLESAGFPLDSYSGRLAADQVLVVGPEGGRQLAAHAAALGGWLKAGGNLLAIGLNAEEANSFLPFKVSMKTEEHIAACFDVSGMSPLLAGVGPADVHNRDPRKIPLVSGGAAMIGNGVLAKAENYGVVFCQLVPWDFQYKAPNNTKRTFRRSSFLVTRLMSDMGAASSTPLLARFGRPVDAAKSEKRWLNGLYLDQPDEWDNPYRFWRW